MRLLSAILLLISAVIPAHLVLAQAHVATTTLTLSICGNSVVDASEACDSPGETGVYSQTITGRQCTPACKYGPYCGDGILQASYGEECDDGNNSDSDFCSALCTIEPAGSGGGGSSGGGRGGGGGSNVNLGDTLIAINGLGYPSRTIQLLLDNRAVGSVQADRNGSFEFTINASPGTATLGIWSTDARGVQSITLNNTFDVTQGAVTNVNGVILPPTISVLNAEVDPGQIVEVSGYASPNAEVRLYVDSNTTPVATVTANSSGAWTASLNTSTLSIAEHTLKARAYVGSGGLRRDSGFSKSLQLFVGVDGRATTPSDLNRDGSINLIDFSILIFWWSTNGGDSNPPADINQNGRVGLEDFSILLFNWTG